MQRLLLSLILLSICICKSKETIEEFPLSPAQNYYWHAQRMLNQLDRECILFEEQLTDSSNTDNRARELEGLRNVALIFRQAVLSAGNNEALRRIARGERMRLNARMRELSPQQHQLSRGVLIRHTDIEMVNLQIQYQRRLASRQLNRFHHSSGS